VNYFRVLYHNFFHLLAGVSDVKCWLGRGWNGVKERDEEEEEEEE
jgi:hypothetical protein